MSGQWLGVILLNYAVKGQDKDFQFWLASRVSVSVLFRPSSAPFGLLSLPAPLTWATFSTQLRLLTVKSMLVFVFSPFRFLSVHTWQFASPLPYPITPCTLYLLPHSPVQGYQSCKYRDHRACVLVNCFFVSHNRVSDCYHHHHHHCSCVCVCMCLCVMYMFSFRNARDPCICWLQGNHAGDVICVLSLNYPSNTNTIPRPLYMRTVCVQGYFWWAWGSLLAELGEWLATNVKYHGSYPDLTTP